MDRALRESERAWKAEPDSVTQAAYLAALNRSQGFYPPEFAYKYDFFFGRLERLHRPTRVFRATWSPEAEQNLDDLWGTDLVAEMAEQMAAEIDREILLEVSREAGRVRRRNSKRRKAERKRRRKQARCRQR